MNSTLKRSSLPISANATGSMRTRQATDCVQDSQQIDALPVAHDHGTE